MIPVGKPHQTLPPKVCNCGIASMVTANHDSGCALSNEFMKGGKDEKMRMPDEDAWIRQKAAEEDGALISAGCMMIPTAAMPEKPGEFEKEDGSVFGTVATPTEQPTTFDKKREITWKLWRDGYGEYYVRPQDAWDAGWRYAEMELRREVAQRDERIAVFENAGCEWVAERGQLERKLERAEEQVAQLKKLRNQLSEAQRHGHEISVKE